MFASFSHAAVRTVLGTAGTLVFAGACLFGATAPAAAATPHGEIRVAAVTFADLNLSSTSGRAVLERRIRTASRDVCKVDGRELRDRSAETQCYDTARKVALAQAFANTMVAAR